MQLQVPETGMIPQQETVIIFLNLYVRISKALKGWVVPSSHLVKLGLTANEGMLPSGQLTHQFSDPPLCDPPLYKWERTEREGLLD